MAGWRWDSDASRDGKLEKLNVSRRSSGGLPPFMDAHEVIPALVGLGTALSGLVGMVESVVHSARLHEPSEFHIDGGESREMFVGMKSYRRRVLASVSQSSSLRSGDLNMLSGQRDQLPPNELVSEAREWDENSDHDSLTPHVLESRNQRSFMSPEELGPPERKGWLGQVGQAKALYKHISLLDRTRIGAIAGGLAGAFTYSCLHPLDTVRTKLQARGAATLYKGPGDVVVSILRTQGVSGFYSGISAVMLGSMLSSALYFGTCEFGKSVLFQMQSFPPLMVPPIASAVGNLVSSAVLVPRDVITQRMQIGASGRSWEVFLRTLYQDGVKGLYAGYSAAVVRALPSSVISFTTFEYLKAVCLKRSKRKALGAWESVISGAMAGAISAALTTPLDVVKTRLMTQARSSVMGHIATGSVIEAELRAKIAAASYKGITSTLNKIWVEEGLTGLTRGMGPRILHSACFSALGYFAFETFRLELVKRHLASVEASRKSSGLVPAFGS